MQDGQPSKPGENAVDTEQVPHVHPARVRDLKKHQESHGSRNATVRLIARSRYVAWAGSEQATDISAEQFNRRGAGYILS